MQFQNIVGQETLKKRLIQTVKEGRISHAQLFLGENGYGALQLAIAYAQYINCTQKLENDSCGTCKSCLKYSKLVHPDLHFSFPVSTNKEIKTKPLSDNFLGNWREINIESPYFNLNDWNKKIDVENKQSLINVNESQQIIKKLSLKPFESEFKIMIIWNAESMNQGASNKLLKLIEEPTDKTIILLVAEDIEQLLNTIISRTQLVRVPPIESSKIIETLEKQYQIDSIAAARYASFAEGNMSKAIMSFKQSEEESKFFELFKNWMRACYEANIEKMYEWVEEISNRSFGREQQKRFLSFALEIMREGLVRNYAPSSLNRFDGEIHSFMKNFAPFVHENNIFGVVEILNESHLHISRNAYPKILFMDMSMKFANLLRVKKRTFVS